MVLRRKPADEDKYSIRDKKQHTSSTCNQTAGAPQYRMQESKVYKKLHILPLESKTMFRDLKTYLVIETSIF